MALRLIDLETPELPAAQPVDISAMAQDMGDQAGLQPLPLGRMFRQAGRPMAGYRSKPNPALQDLTIQRNQRNQQTIESWNPIESENKQRLNNTNPNPRSRPSTPENKTVHKFFMDLSEAASDRMRGAFHDAFRADNKDKPQYSSSYNKAYSENQDLRYKSDQSEFLTKSERNAAKSMLFDYLDKTANGRAELEKHNLPVDVVVRFPKLGNDLLYEWNARRARQMREGTLDMLEIRRDTVRGI